MNNDRGLLSGSITILIGAVIAIMALVRGPWQVWLLLGVFTLWGLWVVLILLLPYMQQAKRHRQRQQRTRQLHAEGIQTRSFEIPGERTVYRVMAEIGLNHKPKRKPNAITKADREASKSNDLIKRDFAAEKPLEKCMTDMTEIKASDGKLYVSAIFDCYDLAVLGLAMDTNMRATLCEQTLENACKAYPMLRGAILHSDRGTQYTSELYRKAINRYGIVQSMNSAGGRCHDNARCESMWARFKEELLYGRYDPTSMTVEQLKTLIWRYFISYWNNRRICSANGGLPPMVKRQQYYASLQEAA